MSKRQYELEAPKLDETVQVAGSQTHSGAKGSLHLSA
jgi:hypothetical protein